MTFPLSGGLNAGTSWGAWGAAAYQAFEGTPDAGGYDGDLTSFHLGADARTDGWVAGASLSRTQASVAYTYDGDATGAGTLDTELTALHPYIQWRPAPGTTLWTILGFGAGEATAQREGRSATGEPATLGMRLGLAGLRMDLGRPAGVALVLRGDAGFAQLETEDGLRAVDGLSVQTQRVRAGVEASRPMPTATGILSPFVEIGARWDGGDGVAGGGIEVAGGVRYRAPNGGVEVKARTLAMHGGEGVAEHGIAATAFIEPGAQGTGLRLSLTPRWGAPESRDVFWRSDYAMRGMRHDPGARRFMFDGRIGYGLALRGRPWNARTLRHPRRLTAVGQPGTDRRALRDGRRARRLALRSLDRTGGRRRPGGLPVAVRCGGPLLARRREVVATPKPALDSGRWMTTIRGVGSRFGRLLTTKAGLVPQPGIEPGRHTACGHWPEECQSSALPIPSSARGWASRTVRCASSSPK